MITAALHAWLVTATFVFAAGTAVALLFISAPYGRHVRAGWGPTIPARLGWVLMESPAVLWFGFVYLQGQYRAEPLPLLLLGAWMFHYVYRTFVFPFRLRIAGKRKPLLIVALALVFNTLNATINAAWISDLGPYAGAALADPRVLVGMAVFAAGWALNQHSDQVLLNLRKPGETGYKIPYGGGYRYVTCPNYLGEIVQWCGWALAAGSLAGLAFAVYTAANLVPRAITHHKWYREKFPDYPAERKAILPFVL